MSPRELQKILEKTVTPCDPAIDSIICEKSEDSTVIWVTRGNPFAAIGLINHMEATGTLPIAN